MVFTDYCLRLNRLFVSKIPNNHLGTIASFYRQCPTYLNLFETVTILTMFDAIGPQLFSAVESNQYIVIRQQVCSVSQDKQSTYVALNQENYQKVKTMNLINVFFQKTCPKHIENTLKMCLLNQNWNSFVCV